jgi:hypothetical protein
MTKTASLYLKGIAILMMLATHLLFFVQSPNILSIPLPNGSNVSAYIGYACALCVPVFAFINGYGLSKVYEGKSLGQIYLYSIKKMGLFLLEYWIILFSLFVPFYACSVAGAVDWLLILRSLFGWGGVLNPFAWYVYFYLGILLLLPLLRYLFPKQALLGLAIGYLPLLIAAFVWGFLDKADTYTSYRELLVYVVCVLGGFVFAKYGLFETARKGLAKIKCDHWWFYLIFTVLGFALTSVVRNVLLFPFTSLPLIFLGVVLFEKPLPRVPSFIFKWLGVLSMPLWFIHYIFFAPYVNRYLNLYNMVTSPRIALAIVLLGLLLCLPLALIYHFLFALPSLLKKKRAISSETK